VNAKRTVNGTVMRVDLPTPLAPGATAVVEIDWSFLLPEGGRNGRGAKEKVRDGWLYEIAQWFPRASVYDDVNGWQTDQFLGQGEFYLNFGNYDVSLRCRAATSCRPPHAAQPRDGAHRRAAHALAGGLRDTARCSSCAPTR
jgi:hypothetical protein